MPPFLIGAIVGAVVGVAMVIIIFQTRKQKYDKIMKSITSEGVEYSALFYYASSSRYKKSFKFFDSYGALYLIGSNLYYKTSTVQPPMTFDLAESKLQQESNWRLLKWFSITTPTGEKHYFDSQKMGLFINNSDETVRALNLYKSKTNF
jgi:hypothetical protein